MGVLWYTCTTLFYIQILPVQVAVQVAVQATYRYTYIVGIHSTKTPKSPHEAFGREDCRHFASAAAVDLPIIRPLNLESNFEFDSLELRDLIIHPSHLRFNPTFDSLKIRDQKT